MLDRQVGDEGHVAHRHRRLDEAGAKQSQDESAEAAEVATASEQAADSQPEAPVAANEVEAVAEAAAAREGGEAEEGEEGEEEEGAEVELSPEAAVRLAYEEKLAKVLELAKHNPKVLGNLIKEWMGSNEQQR